MVKSELVVPPTPEPQPLTFPALYKFIYHPQVLAGSFVVLFSEPSVGTIVWSEHPLRKVGSHITSWQECTDTDVWEPLPQGVSITLTNPKE